MSDPTAIHPLGSRADISGQADGHGESNGRFSLFMWSRLKRGNLTILESWIFLVS